MARETIWQKVSNIFLKVKAYMDELGVSGSLGWVFIFLKNIGLIDIEEG